MKYLTIIFISITFVINTYALRCADEKIACFVNDEIVGKVSVYGCLNFLSCQPCAFVNNKDNSKNLGKWMVMDCRNRLKRDDINAACNDEESCGVNASWSTWNDNCSKKCGKYYGKTEQCGYHCDN